jgi:ribosomal protein S1
METERMAYGDWRRVLSERSPARDSAEVEKAWAEVKQQFAIGQSVTGVVVARAPFGAWVDLGVGFAGLLQIIFIDGLTPERYQGGDWCSVGSKVTAFVGGFINHGNQIGLWQVRPRHELQP